jgi:hypothetical protein
MSLDVTYCRSRLAAATHLNGPVDCALREPRSNPLVGGSRASRAGINRYRDAMRHQGTDPFSRACRGERVPYTPVWLNPLPERAGRPQGSLPGGQRTPAQPVEPDRSRSTAGPSSTP